MGQSERASVAEATVVEALRNQRRRYALYYLQNHDAPVTLDELVEQVAAWERVTMADDAGASHRKSVYSSLHRTHLPYLEGLGLVAYDRQCKQVAWYRVYFLLSVVGVFVVGALWVAVPPVGALSPLLAATLILVGFAAVSFLHWYDIRRWHRQTADMPPDFLLTLGDEVTTRDPDEGANGGETERERQ